MKVKTLIKRLQTQDPEAHVFQEFDNMFFKVTNIKTNRFRQDGVGWWPFDKGVKGVVIK